MGPESTGPARVIRRLANKVSGPYYRGVSLDPYVSGALISSGASLFGGAFGGSSASDVSETSSRQYRKAIAYQPRLNKVIMKQRMRDAKRHSIHPLVMMGINPGTGGGFSGQLTGGNNIGRGIADAGHQLGQAVANSGTRELQKERMVAEIELLKAQATALGQKPPQDPAPGMPGQNVQQGVVPPIHHPTQEFKKAEVLPHAKGNPQKGMGVRPLTNGITIGDQTIQMMVDEPADIAEDPAKILIAAALDRSNTGVQWRKAIRDYAGIAHPRDYKARNLAERVITREFLWGLAKLKRSYKIPRYMGR